VHTDFKKLEGTLVVAPALFECIFA